MASSLTYAPPLPPPFTADDDLRQLLEALHRSGTLRALTGLFGRLGAVSDVALQELNSEAGRNVLGALLFLGKVLAEMPADDLVSVTRGLQAGFQAAELVVQKEPPSLLGLVALAREPETRRAFAVLLTLAHRVGSQLGHSG